MAGLNSFYGSKIIWHFISRFSYFVLYQLSYNCNLCCIDNDTNHGKGTQRIVLSTIYIVYQYQSNVSDYHFLYLTFLHAVFLFGRFRVPNLFLVLWVAVCLPSFCVLCSILPACLNLTYLTVSWVSQMVFYFSKAICNLLAYITKHWRAEGEKFSNISWFHD